MNKDKVANGIAAFISTVLILGIFMSTLAMGSFVIVAATHYKGDNHVNVTIASRCE